VIEWWQALLIALAAGALPTTAALAVEEMRHRHDLTIQAKRLAAERLAREDEATRAMKRERLQPAFEALADLERELTYLSTGETIESLNLAPKEKEYLLAQIKRHRPTRPQNLYRIESAVLRVGDAELAVAILNLSVSLLGDKPDTATAGRTLRGLYDRLEAYAAKIDRPGPRQATTNGSTGVEDQRLSEDGV